MGNATPATPAPKPENPVEKFAVNPLLVPRLLMTGIVVATVPAPAGLAGVASEMAFVVLIS
jgi:hypothetical protein